MKDKEEQFKEFQDFAKKEFGVEIIKDNVNGKEYTFEELFGINPNKEKQIEEMARIIGHCYCDKECQNKCAYCDISSLNEAKKLYENGFRKLPEDSVVLSKEEYEKYQNLKRDVEHSFEYNQGYTDGQIKGSKETAEKIFKELLKEAKDAEFGGWIELEASYVYKKIIDKAKQFGVEIKE